MPCRLQSPTSIGASKQKVRQLSLTECDKTSLEPAFALAVKVEMGIDFGLRTGKSKAFVLVASLLRS